ncbi:hypothetical protein GJAV_G00074470 [Gymnothorax javanicus]|nr:hypothetical protein GJAV_G00074470 [Gymnothorax javanicus]
MACPFLNEVAGLDEEAFIVRRAFRRERVLRDRLDPLLHHDDHLYERNRFSGDGIRYLCRLLGPHIQRRTARSRAITVPQMVCVALRFFASFPNVIGALDCTHVQIKRPSGPNEGDFINRKSFHSINVQMICDADCLFSNVVAKWPGSVHNARIFRASSIHQRMSQGEFAGILLGDKGYGCQPFLLTPSPDPRTEELQSCALKIQGPD